MLFRSEFSFSDREKLIVQANIMCKQFGKLPAAGDSMNIQWRYLSFYRPILKPGINSQIKLLCNDATKLWFAERNDSFRTHSGLIKVNWAPPVGDSLDGVCEELAEMNDGTTKAWLDQHYPSADEATKKELGAEFRKVKKLPNDILLAGSVAGEDEATKTRVLPIRSSGTTVKNALKKTRQRIKAAEQKVTKAIEAAGADPENKKKAEDLSQARNQLESLNDLLQVHLAAQTKIKEKEKVTRGQDIEVLPGDASGTSTSGVEAEQA